MNKRKKDKEQLWKELRSLLFGAPSRFLAVSDGSDKSWKRQKANYTTIRIFAVHFLLPQNNKKMAIAYEKRAIKQRSCSDLEMNVQRLLKTSEEWLVPKLSKPDGGGFPHFFFAYVRVFLFTFCQFEAGTRASGQSKSKQLVAQLAGTKNRSFVRLMHTGRQRYDDQQNCDPVLLWFLLPRLEISKADTGEQKQLLLWTWGWEARHE